MALVFYNLYFIPLQFAYRIPFKGGILALEILTIVFYLAEISLRFLTLIRLRRLKATQLELIKSLSDRRRLIN